MFYLIVLMAMLAALAVFRMIRQIFQQYRCLSDETLDLYMRGKLSKDQAAYDQAIAHLGICDECQERLSSYASDDKSKEGLEDHLVE